MFERGTGGSANKFWKMGRRKVAPNKETPLMIVTKIEVGPGGSQATLGELKELIKRGDGLIQKQANDGKTDRARVDFRIRVGKEDDQWTIDELREIVEIIESDEYAAEKKKLDALREEAYQEAYKAELKKELEAEIRAEMTAKAKKDAAKKVKDDRPDTAGTGSAGAGRSNRKNPKPAAADSE